MATIFSMSPTRVVFRSSGSGLQFDSDNDYMRKAGSGMPLPRGFTWYFGIGLLAGTPVTTAWRWSCGTTSRQWNDTDTPNATAPSSDPSYDVIDFLG